MQGPSALIGRAGAVSLAPDGVKVAMIGPVPTHWGGGAGWRGGGIASHVQGLLSVLPASGVQVQLLADNTDSSQQPPFPTLSPAVKLKAMARSPQDLLRLGPKRGLWLAWRMARDPEVRRSAPPGQLARFWGQTVNFDHFLAGTPADVVHLHQAFNRQYLCQRVLGLGLPLVVTVHSVNALLEPNPAWVGRMIRTNYRRAELMIAVSNYVKDQIIGYGAEADRITVITNGVDIEMFAPQPQAAARQQLRLPTDGFVVLFSGNLIRRKGVDVLIKAFSRCTPDRPEARLVIIGTGDEQEGLARLASELGVQAQVMFAGYKAFTEMPLWYQACDVFVMPSWAEGLSMSILEAMASGRPVITSRPETGEHDAVVAHETGFLTEYGDVEELSHAMERLMASSGLAQHLGHTARSVAAERFSWDLIGRKTAEVYRLAVHQAQSR